MILKYFCSVMAFSVHCLALSRPDPGTSSTDDQGTIKMAESALLEQKYQHALLQVWDVSINNSFTQDPTAETEDPLAPLANSTIPRPYLIGIELVPQYEDDFYQENLDALKASILGGADAPQNLRRRDEWSIPYPEGLDDDLKALYRDALEARLDVEAVTQSVYENAWTRVLYNPDINPNTLNLFIEGLEKLGVNEVNVGLRAYNLAPGPNKLLKAIGSKVIHSAITISHPNFPGLGLEVWFNGGVTIDVIKPGQYWLEAFSHITEFKDTNMGKVPTSAIKSSLSNLMQKWGPQIQYHLLKSNCNHFSDDFLFHLQQEGHQVVRAPKSLNPIARIGAVLEEKVVARFPALQIRVSVLLTGVDGSADTTPNTGSGKPTSAEGSSNAPPKGDPRGQNIFGENFWITDEGKYVDGDGFPVSEDLIPIDERDAENNGAAGNAGDANQDMPDRGTPAGKTKDGESLWIDNEGKLTDAQGKEVTFDQVAELADEYLDDVANRVSTAGAEPGTGGVSTAKPAPGVIKSFLSKNALLLTAGMGAALEVVIALPFVIMHFLDGEYLAGVGILVGTTVGAIGGAALATVAVESSASSVALLISGRVATFAARFVIGAIPALGFAFLALMVAMKIFSEGFTVSKPAEGQIVDMMCFGHRGTTQPDPSQYNVTDMEQIKMSPAFIADKFSGSDMLATQLLFLKYSGAS